jgi:DNA-directed RNA polymerase alpha subunit
MKTFIYKATVSKTQRDFFNGRPQDSATLLIEILNGAIVHQESLAIKTALGECPAIGTTCSVEVKFPQSGEMLDNLDFSVRTYNELRSMGFSSLPEVISHTKLELSRDGKLGGRLGRKSLRELCETLSAKGLHLRI